jgi:hypothetical protein
MVRGGWEAWNEMTSGGWRLRFSTGENAGEHQALAAAPLLAYARFANPLPSSRIPGQHG